MNCLLALHPPATDLSASSSPAALQHRSHRGVYTPSPGMRPPKSPGPTLPRTWSQDRVRLQHCGKLAFEALAAAPSKSPQHHPSPLHRRRLCLRKLGGGEEDRRTARVNTARVPGRPRSAAGDSGGTLFAAPKMKTQILERVLRHTRLSSLGANKQRHHNGGANPFLPASTFPREMHKSRPQCWRAAHTEGPPMMGAPHVSPEQPSLCSVLLNPSVRHRGVAHKPASPAESNVKGRDATDI